MSDKYNSTFHHVCFVFFLLNRLSVFVQYYIDQNYLFREHFFLYHYHIETDAGPTQLVIWTTIPSNPFAYFYNFMYS